MGLVEMQHMPRKASSVRFQTVAGATSFLHVLAMVTKSVTTAGIATFPGEASAKQYSG